MEICLWILLMAGIATTAARLGWAGPPAATAVASAWAAVPWLTSDRVSAANAARLFAWASELDRVGALATVAVVEALIGGWAALWLAGSDQEDDRQGPRHRLMRWASSALPSPSLAVGLVGAQASLFHRASGWSFSAVDAAMSAATFAALAGLGTFWRFVWPEAGRRAAGAIPLFAALLAFGAALPPWLDPRPKGVKSVEIDVRATAFLLALVAVGAGLGVVGRLARGKVIRKGGDAP